MSRGAGFRLSREAERDIRDIEDYSARTWGEVRAANYIHDLFAAFRDLAAMPKRGRRRADIPVPYLVYAVGSHLIIYRQSELRGGVEILNILHPAMNIEKRVIEALKRKGA